MLGFPSPDRDRDFVIQIAVAVSFLRPANSFAATA
jgi:hypothetical protein